MAISPPTEIGYGVDASADEPLQVAHSGISAGDLIVVCVCMNDTASEGYVVASIDVESDSFVCASDSGVASIWYKVCAYDHSSESTIDVTPDGPLALAVVVTKMTGHAAAPLDKVASATGTGTSPSSGNTATRTDRDAYAVAAIGTKGPSADSAGVWTSPYASVARYGAGSSTNGATIAVGRGALSGTGATNGQKSSITSRDWGACVATFMEDPNQTTNATAHEATAAHEAGTSTPGAVSTDANEHEATAVHETGTSSPGVRVVAGSAHEATALHEAGDDGGAAYITPAAYDADSAPTKALRIDSANRYGTLRAVDATGHLGDGDLATYVEDVETGPTGSGGVDLAVACTSMAASSISGSGVISGVVLHAYCRVTADTVGGDPPAVLTLSSPVFVLPGQSVAMTTMPPTGTYGESMAADSHTALITTTDGSTAWTWDNIFAALAGTKVQVHAVYDGLGLPLTLTVGELWAEVFGPLGAPRRQMVVQQVVAPIRVTLESKLTL